MHLWRAYEGPERFDCLSIGKVLAIAPGDMRYASQSGWHSVK